MSSESPKTAKRTGFFNKLRQKKFSSHNNSFASESNTSNGSITSSTFKSDKLQRMASRGSISRSRDLSEERRGGNGGVVDDNYSLLCNGDVEDEDGSMMMEYDSDISSSTSLLHSLSASTRHTRPRADTFDDHKVDEKVSFPGAENYLLDSDLQAVTLHDDQEPPWVGLTFESFLTPKYVKISKRNRQSPKIINDLFLAQELNVYDSDGIRSNESSENELESDSYEEDNSGFEQKPGLGMSREIFVMKFSNDGKYLAAAGRDTVIRIWKVIASPLGRLEFNQHERENGTPERSSKRDHVFQSAPVFHRTPLELRGHTHSILSLAWSKNNFLISGSMDKTAKLWHVDRPVCLQTFQHEDFVTAVEFHPLDDRFFLSGSLDNEVRLWSVLEKSVSYWRNLGQEVLITALSFTPDGLYCAVGGFNGSLFILETKGLHVVNRVEIKEKSIVHPFHDKNGNKITGIEVFANPSCDLSDIPESSQEKWTVLITTNDSKIRMVSTHKKKLITRFRGLVNNSSSIAASSSDDHKYVISGSEDHWCYIWENNNTIINNKLRQSLKELVVDGKQHITELHQKSRKYSKLFNSHKFLAKLFDSENESKHDFIANENNSYSSFHAHHSKCNVAIFAPAATKNLLQLSDDLIFDLKKRGEACKMDPSKCYCGNAKEYHHHHEKLVGEGDIIVTTDQYGLIRVFRQDCASSYRKQFIEFYKKCQIGYGGSGNNGDVTLSSANTIKSIPRRRFSLHDRSSPVRVDPSKNIKAILGSQISTYHDLRSNDSLVSPPTSALGSSIPTSSTSFSHSNDMYAPNKSRQPNNSNLDTKEKASSLVYANANASATTLNVMPNEHAHKINSHQENFPKVNNENNVRSVPSIVVSTEESPKSTKALKIVPTEPSSNGSPPHLADIPIHASRNKLEHDLTR
ncbi:hypothetical protein KGF56_003961 [Candida oxycetoniae]|uniref:Uncharacterized protein n=1 Tax=Candida oxycetoniae TaxID=497107 RepID=A0AAI9SUP4_9ASCO|nr:uncharacterized protein KGF56_003961 [Candida oxycetoniae]KAI3403226.2 hypothetical protein KGF56_003961 [Candida oxycetoniae]